MISASAPRSTADTGAGMTGIGLNRIGRYLAAVAGVMVIVLFYQPWVDASIVGVGEDTLTGVQLAQGQASLRMSRAALAASRSGAGPQANVAAAAGAAASGLTMPTRIPTVASGAGAGGLTLPTRIPTVASGTSAGAPVGATGGSGSAGGLTLPTRIPTVASGTSAGASAGASSGTSAGASSGFGSTGAVTQATPLAAPSGATSGARPEAPPALPPAPDTLPQTFLFLVPLAGLGIVAFSMVWDRLTEGRDRSYGKAWTLILSFGGTLWMGNIVYKVVNAPADNSLIGAGVGSVQGAQLALWGVFAAFLVSAICLTIAWLSPAPPPPDPYYRVRQRSG
jgi:hypothetical protein